MRTTLLRNTLAALAALFIAAFALPAQAQTKEAYVVQSPDGRTLTFYYDTQRATRPGTTYGINDTQTEEGRTYPAWTGTNLIINETLKKAAFDASFKDYRPTSTARWFYRYKTLAEITGMENLNTEEVTDMSGMFGGCQALTAIDVSNFNTENVTNMSGMFDNCQALTAIDLSNFNTEKVTDMSGIFFECRALTAIDVSNFNTEKVTDMSYMFLGCKALTAIDLSNFNTEKVTDMRAMFYDCQALTAIDLSNFNTEKVTDMHWMFRDCQALTAIDLSNFNTENVTDMSMMFDGCEALTTITCDDDWNRAGLDSGSMFKECTKLKGAVAYDETKTDAAMANPTTGYFTKKDLTAIAAPEVQAAVQEIHSPDGCRRATLRPGPNLLRLSDGTTRKVLRR